MPPWKGKLTDEESSQLWHYIRANACQNRWGHMQKSSICFPVSGPMLCR
jgi:hypothetical protein